MPGKKRVLILGKSLNLAGLASCLKVDSNLDVHFIDPCQLSTREVLEKLNPDTIIYDLTDPPIDLDLVLLADLPGTQMIGVDPSSDDVLVLTGKRSRVVTAGELTQLVSNHTDKKQVKQRTLSG